MKRIIILLCCLAFMSAGCGESAVGPFVAGLGTGMVVKVNEANKAVEKISANIDILNEKSKELETIIAGDPVVLANVLDPNLGDSLTEFIVNVKELAAKADEFKEESGKVDWERLLMSIGIGILGGGTGVNIFKNRKNNS